MSVSALCAWLMPGDGVIDVGANVGNYAEAFAKAVGPTGKVVALEPDPETAERCRAKCEPYPQITVQSVALTDRAGMVTLYRDTDDRRRNSLWCSNLIKDTGECVDVPAITLDAVVATVPRLAGIKIDAQGAEALILRGATQTLQRDNLAWYVEMWPPGVAASGATIGEVIGAFADHGWEAHGLSWAEVRQKAEIVTGHGSFDILVRKAGVS